MEIKKLSSILKENSLDGFNDEREKERRKHAAKDIENFQKDNELRAKKLDYDKNRESAPDNTELNAKLDKELGDKIAAHQKNKDKEPESNTPDYNQTKTEVVDKLGEIIFYALQSGDKAPLDEANSIIAKYNKYLKSEANYDVSTKDVKTYTGYSNQPLSSEHRKDNDNPYIKGKFFAR